MSSDPTILTPPPLAVPDEVDRDHHHHHHLGNEEQSSANKSVDQTTTAISTSATISNEIIQSFSTSNTVVTVLRDTSRPVSVHEMTSDECWTVRINIPAAESSELLTRLECERQSIRGSTHYLTSSPVAADVELMELLERDLLLTNEEEEEEEEQEPTPESVENPQRSLSLPKSFLATKYGLIGLKAALPRYVKHSFFFPTYIFSISPLACVLWRPASRTKGGGFLKRPWHLCTSFVLF